VVSTVFVESTVNQVIAKRFAKKKQMQWTPRGVHLLMQLRTRVLDGTLDNDFTRWRNERRNLPNEAKMAAWHPQLFHAPQLDTNSNLYVPHLRSLPGL
jgi:hypothetical protein